MYEIYVQLHMLVCRGWDFYKLLMILHKLSMFYKTQASRKVSPYLFLTSFGRNCSYLLQMDK